MRDNNKTNNAKNSTIKLPSNRVIRKRIAARTVAIHLSALSPELQVFIDTTNSDYLTKRDLPEELHLTIGNGEKKVFSRNEAWEFADEAGSKLEWDILPDSTAGKATAMFSTTGQGIYANYGRPSMDFSGFYHDHISTTMQLSGDATSQGVNPVMLGPLFIAMDTASAAGFTALGHITRGAKLTNKAVLSDIVSTGIYEGSTSLASAKLGVFTGAKVIRLTAALPIPGAHLAAIPVGFLVGAATAIFTKRFTNRHKNSVIDSSYQFIQNYKTSESPKEVITI